MCIFPLQAPESGRFPLFSIPWPQSNRAIGRSVAVLCCWVPNVPSVIIFEWREQQRQPGGRLNKDDNSYHSVPGTVSHSLNVTLPHVALIWAQWMGSLLSPSMPRGLSDLLKVIQNGKREKLKLTVPNTAEMGGPGQSNSEDSVISSVVNTWAFLIQRSGPSPGKILLLPVIALNLLFFLKPFLLQFSFSLWDDFGFRVNAVENTIFLE